MRRLGVCCSVVNGLPRREAAGGYGLFAGQMMQARPILHPHHAPAIIDGRRRAVGYGVKRLPVPR